MFSPSKSADSTTPKTVISKLNAAISDAGKYFNGFSERV